jgi:hypothetical protein
LCLIYPLVQGRELGWPVWTFLLMSAGIALLGVFALVERRGHGTPLIEPSLLRNRAFTSGLAVGIAFFAGFAGLLLVLSVFFQAALGFTAKYGRRVLRVGILVIIVSLAGLAAIVDHHGTDLTTWTMVPALVPFGLGLGFVFGPLFNVILAGVDDREVGSASGTLNAVRQLGNSVGVALLATIFFSLLDHGHLSAAAMRDTTLSFLLPKEARMDDPH